MLHEYIATCWTVHLITALAVSAIWIVLTRRYARRFKKRVSEYSDKLNEQEQNYESMLQQQFQELSEKEEQLSEKSRQLSERSQQLQELYYRIHHAGPRPAMASVLGLLDLSSRESVDLGQTLDLLSRPNHHKYASLAIKHKTEMDTLRSQIEVICRKLYEDSVKPTKEL